MAIGVQLHVIKATTDPSVAPFEVGQHWINTLTDTQWLAAGTSSIVDWKLVQTSDKFRVSATDTIAGYLFDSLTVASGSNTTDPLEAVILNPSADEVLQLVFDQSKLVLTASQISDFTEAVQDASFPAMVDTSSIDFIYNDAGNQITAVVLPAGVDHDLLFNFVANKHIDHSAVSISPGTGLSGGGDITATRTLGLANTAVSSGSYGSASQVGQFTVDAQGRLTAASNAAIAITSAGVTDFNEAAQDAVGGILTDSADIDFTYNDGAGTISALLFATAVTPGSYGSASGVGTFTVDSKGRLTAAGSTSIAIAASAITSGTLPINRGGTNSATALNNNRVMASSGSAIVEAAAITAARALISDANGIPIHSSVTSSELAFLSGSAVTNGGIIYGNGSAFRASAAGSAYQYLISNGAAAPSWQTLATGNTVATAETTTSTSFTDLATSGPAATVTTGTSALVTVTGKIANTNNGTSNLIGFAVSGATTVAASDAQSLLWAVSGGSSGQVSATYLVTGLTAGSNTFTAKYRVSANTGTFTNRSIIVMPI